MDITLLKALNTCRANRVGVIRVSALDGSSERLVRDDEDLASDLLANDLLADELAARFRSGKSGLVSTDEGDLFLTVFLPPPRIIAIGAVHISQALVDLARLAHFDLTIVDPRTAFATEDRFEGVALYAEWPEDVLPGLNIDRYTALAALTHDPKIDDWALGHALERQCFYVGALGSRKTHGKRLDRLSQQGVAQDSLARIHAPIGLDIGATNPQEIAIAVMAEIITTLRKASKAG